MFCRPAQANLVGAWETARDYLETMREAKKQIQATESARKQMADVAAERAKSEGTCPKELKPGEWEKRIRSWEQANTNAAGPSGWEGWREHFER